MQLVQHLGRALKSDELLDLIELQDLKIQYHVDTLHENTPDSYSARSEDLAFELLFNENQILTTVFHYISPEENIDTQAARIGVPLYLTLDEARQAAVAMGVPFAMRENVEIPELGLMVCWAKLTVQGHTRHYQFSAKGLDQLTLSLR